MTNNGAKTEQFTGLILLTAEDRPGIAAQLFQTLAPFSVSVIDMGQIVISKRVILSVLITLNPAHQMAIETDLALCATNNDVDIATIFSTNLPSAKQLPVITLGVSSEKLHPSSLNQICSSVRELGGNIESIQADAGVENLYLMVISGIPDTELRDAMNQIDFEYQTKVIVG